MIKTLIMMELLLQGIPQEFGEFIAEKFKPIILNCFSRGIKLGDISDIVMEKMNIFKCSSCNDMPGCSNRKADYISGHEKIFNAEMETFFNAGKTESNPEPNKKPDVEELPASVLEHRFNHLDN